MSSVLPSVIPSLLFFRTDSHRLMDPQSSTILDQKSLQKFVDAFRNFKWAYFHHQIFTIQLWGIAPFFHGNLRMYHPAARGVPLDPSRDPSRYPRPVAHAAAEDPAVPREDPSTSDELGAAVLRIRSGSGADPVDFFRL